MFPKAVCAFDNSKPLKTSFIVGGGKTVIEKTLNRY
jgi:hypothetical protein